MNYAKLFFFVMMANIQPIFSMQESQVLTADESTALQWFEQTKTAIGWGFKNLSTEDQAVFKQGVHYSDDQQILTRIMQHFVSGFCQQAAQTKTPLKYDESLISSILIKQQSYIAARMYVFSQLLTAAERSTIQRDNYLNNPEAALTVMTKSGILLAQELARLNLIPNTMPDQEKAAQEFTQNKMDELKRAYAY